MKHLTTLLAVTLAVSSGWAKDKSKSTLPDYVLQAKTVAVVIDPAAQFSLDGPQVNLSAQKEVEAALLKWGRFETVSDAHTADLLIVIRKGSGRATDPTLPDLRQNSGGMGSGGAGSAGPQRGPQSSFPADSGMGADQPSSRGATGMGGTEDYFAVFKGGQNPHDAAPAWRYVGQDGLHPETVPAVTAFKKAITNAEKAAQKQPPPQ